MRVMAGSARGVPLKTVPDMNTRPILDRIKKSLFSILESSTLILDARVADFYAGAGTQGIEALSRGAESCLFVERRPEAVALLKENLAKCRLAEKADVRCATVSSVISSLAESQKFDLILYDPPFSFSREDASRGEAEIEMALAGKLLYPGHARLVLRFEKKADPPAPAGLELTRHWTDGPHAFAFYGLK
ncbi:MAG TPA: RsmD family RNA methyltransferase [Planctomycetota bacterium]|nr:RsmD family RNA methyltransferase [Planctomycetota bacterium]